MNLVIAEKPSVEQNIAAIIGATAKKDGYMEGNGYLVSWCIGHRWNSPPPIYMVNGMASGSMKIYLTFPQRGNTSFPRTRKNK